MQKSLGGSCGPQVVDVGGGHMDPSYIPGVLKCSE